MQQRQRLFVVISCFLPSLVVAGIALVTQESSLFLAFGFSLLAGGISAGLTWMLTREAVQTQQLLEDLRPILETSYEESDKLTQALDKLPALSGKSTTEVVKNLTERLIQRLQQLDENTFSIVTTFQLLADPSKNHPPTFHYRAPEGKYEQAVPNSYNYLTKSLQISRQRLEAFSSFLREMPAPLIITDNQQRIITANPAAEKLFDLTSKQLQKVRLQKLLADNVSPLDADGGETEKPLTPFLAMSTLKKMPDNEVLVQRADKDSSQYLKIKARLTSQYSAFVFRPVNDELVTSRNKRLHNRQQTLRSVATYLQKQIESPIKKAQADLRVMAGTIKRMPQKDQLLPTFTSCQQNLAYLNIVHDLLEWLLHLETKSYQFGEPEEVKLSEVTDKVENQLEGLLNEKNLTLDIVDDGAWCYADESCLTTLVAGLLTHAINASTGQEIEMVLGRTKKTAQDQIELRCNYKSQPIDTEMLKDLDDPYRRLNSTLFDSTVPGSALGLYVAKHLATLLGGELLLDSLASGQTTLIATFAARPAACAIERPDFDDDIQARVGQFTFGGTAPAIMAETVDAELENGQEDVPTEMPDNVSLANIDINMDDTALVPSDALGDWQLGQ